jgi:P27 family predicted phage terminase small subunit
MKRPAAPRHLDARAKSKWREVLLQLSDNEQGTLDALAAYCAAWSRMVDAELKVSELGTVIKTEKGLVPNPYLSILQQERRAVRQWSDSLKLNPKAKGRPKKTDDDHPADSVLRLIAQ